MPRVVTALAPVASAAPGIVRPRSPSLDPRRFGRLVRPSEPVAPTPPDRSLLSDLRLFAVTFLAGFLFVSVLLA